VPDLPPPGSAIRVTDPQALRALAHPLRTRLLLLLRIEGPSTATQLGARLGESSGATSYHLRELARYGFVEDAPGRGSGRERWWQAVHRSTSWNMRDFTGEDAAVVSELQHRLIEMRGRLLGAWLQEHDGTPEQWRGVTSLNDLPLRLTPDQARRLSHELAEVLIRWRDQEQAPPGTPGTEVVQVFVDVFPLRDYPL